MRISGQSGTLSGDWTIQITQGTVVESNADHMVLSEDSVGVISHTDGSQITFDGLERIEW